MSRRVVVTGLGVLAPNGNGLRDFELALRKGRSGLRKNADMEESGFACRVAGVPEGVDALAAACFDEDLLLAMNAGHRYTALACVEAWQDAGLTRPERDDDRVDWDTGAILGTGIGGMDTIAERWDEVVWRGDRDAGEFSAWYLDAGRLAAALSVGRSEDLAHARRLIESGADVSGDRDALSDADSDLDEIGSQG